MPQFDVTVAGELNLDFILYGLPQELELERELLADRLMIGLGGSSTIVAHNLAALGCRVGFISRIGDDPLGKIALERMAAGGVDVSRMRCLRGSTTGLSLILQRDKSRTILTYLGTMSELCLEDLDLEYLSSSRHYHLSSYYLLRGLQPDVIRILERMKTTGLTISLDTNDDPEDRWEGVDQVLPYVDVFLPNDREAKKIAKADDLDTALARLAKIVPAVVVKMGAQGAIAQRGSERFTSSAVNVDVVDAVGAGDSFDAGFLAQFVRGADLPTCLAYGNLAGAFSTTRPGGTEAFRDQQYRREFFEKHTPKPLHR